KPVVLWPEFKVTAGFGTTEVHFPLMARPKQNIMLLALCATALFMAYILYSRVRWRDHIKPRSSKKHFISDAHVPNPIQIVETPKESGRQISSRKNETAIAKTVATRPLQTELQTRAPATIKTNCKIYNELRNVDFQQPALRHVLCSGAKAYEKAAGGFPMCRLQNPFDDRILEVVRSDSSTADLLDMNNTKVKMFVYSERDSISEVIKTSHEWERELVHTTMRLALKVPNATFLDAGCNIGVYSLLAARLGLPVVSLDANIRNLLRLRLSLNAAALDAALVWNFIGSGDQLSFLNFPDDCNVGGATKFGRAVVDSIPVMPVRSERLCGLIGTRNVVIKLDIEGGEADFLRTSGCLFSQFRVVFVQMEFLRQHMVGTDSATIVDFFASRNYSAWRTPGLSALDVKNAELWEDCDILWIHKDFDHLIYSEGFTLATG
ncbi:hypothetical protein BOX15_Mlig015726g1, partial [Macrostomum lignano]